MAKDELDDIPTDDDKPEPMDDAECCRQAGELSRRLTHTADAIEKDHMPATSSDVATLRDVIDFLDRLANDKETEESLRAGDNPDDGRTLAEWVDDDRRAARQSRKVQEWLRRP